MGALKSPRAQGVKLTDVWLSLQITHYGGKYSIERMLALEEYVRKTSLSRVLFVVIGTPLPALALILCQESIPLQDPAAGWDVNYGFWARMLILGFGAACGTVVQLNILLDGIGLTKQQTVLLGVCVAVGHTATAMLVAKYWVFPVPFVNFTVSSVLFMILIGVLRLLLGNQRFQHILSQQKALRHCATFLSVQILMVSIYPAYQVLFDFATHSRYELPVLLLLPAMKLILRNIFTSTICHMEDTIPEQVIFTVDFFDAFYLAMSMQMASSTATVVIIVIVDFIQTAIDLFELYQRTRGILERLGETEDAITSSFLVAVRSRIHQFDAFHAIPPNIRVRSCIVHQVSVEGRLLFDKIGHNHDVGSTDSSLILSRSIIHAIPRATPLAPLSRRVSAFGSAVKPAEIIPNVVHAKVNLNKQPIEENLDVKPNTTLIYESLEVLFTAECLVLTEYMETFVPLLYATFIVAMAHLPSARYHTEMEGVTVENVGGKIQSVFVYAVLELLSFVVLAVIMWRNCGIRAVYHLAFVLETQATLVQSKLMLWMIMTLTYRITHFGIAGIGH